MKNSLQELQRALGPLCKENVALRAFTTFKIGGVADLFLEARTKEILVSAIQHAVRLKIPYTILGGGSNILIGDGGIRGLVIKNLTQAITIRGIKGKYADGDQESVVYIEVDSGYIFNSFVRFTIEEGYKGIEMHLGLPGSVGGAIYMNSKWVNPLGYVGDLLHQATILSTQGEVKTVSRDYFHFAYDDSVLQKTKETLITATFAFKRAKKEELWLQANESIQYRRASQPQGVFTPGCTFRNIKQSDALTIPTPDHTTSAGYLIDLAGLKGYTIGGAKVSSIHANFIENTGNATSQDVIQLIEYVRHKVKEKFTVELEEEIVRLGEF
jgi:UDP-N-acetylmuramate dehydrogenase